jgi:hypothetical protein
MPSFLSRVKSFHQQYTASVRGCQEGKQKRATPKCSALKEGVGLVALDIVDEINHRLQRGLAFAFAQSPTVAKTDKRIGDPDTGVGLPDFGVNNAGIVEEGDKQRAKPMPIGFGKVRTDQQLIVEWADNVFVRRGRLF